MAALTPPFLPPQSVLKKRDHVQAEYEAKLEAVALRKEERPKVRGTPGGGRAVTPRGVPGEFMSPDRYDQSHQCWLAGVDAILFLSLLPFMSDVHWGLSFSLLFPGILCGFFFF